MRPNIVDVCIAPKINKVQPPSKISVKYLYRGLIDTGAHRTCISGKVARALKISGECQKPLSGMMRQVHHCFIGFPVQEKAYMFNFADREVFEWDFSQSGELNVVIGYCPYIRNRELVIKDCKLSYSIPDEHINVIPIDVC